MSGRRLFDRRWVLTLGDLDVSELDIAFKVKRTTARAPSSAEVKVWNLSADEASSFETATNRLVILRAGYRDDGDPPPTLFRGTARRHGIRTEPDGIDLATIMTARDGGEEYALRRFSRAYPPGTLASTVLRDAVDALAIGRGNLNEFGRLEFLNGLDSFPDGYIYAGPARDAIDTIIRGAGLRWSIQSGTLQIQERGRALATERAVLADDTGLLEAPVRDHRGTVTVQVLLQPGLEPGRSVRLETARVTGDYEIRSAEYEGETRGEAWHTTLTLRPSR